jgi:TM2 domain-containing membrane protein YozV
MQQKDSGLALILEILPGLFGFLGIGYMYAGYTTRGILQLVGWWIILAIAFVISAATAGIGFLCFAPFAIGVPIVSGLLLKERMKQGG